MSRAAVLISVAELAPILDEVVLLDVRWRLGEPVGSGRERYLAGHVPGARFLDLETVLTRHGAPTDGRHPLPDAATLAAGLGALGVAAGSTLVVYDEAYMESQQPVDTITITPTPTPPPPPPPKLKKKKKKTKKF